MRFQPDFLDELRLRIPIADVVGRRVKLQRKGHEHTGLCPFHNEKTASFTVNDEKAFYHCFGCGAHGDVIKFLMETEGLSFPESVERLAGEAGLALPERTSVDEESSRKRSTLYDVMEKAASWFESQLHSNIGSGASAYVEGRGLTNATVTEFRMGFAPESRTMLHDALLARGVTEDQLVDAGLVIKPDDGGVSYDRFRNRLMFPIFDPQGRVVAFGGRALGEARAKYLNSPETSLFHKGRLLYNLKRARESARQTNRLIVVEGYMDVIALFQSGFADVVAPLGTAVTEQQIELMWRITPEPILCFDGDIAGRRASARAMERVMPMLHPAHSLRFAYLPQGEDPDSLVIKSGSVAFEDVLIAARTLVDELWTNTLEASPVDTPERRAGLKSRLDQAIGEIRDDTVRRLYFEELGNRFRALNRLGQVGDGGHTRSRATRQTGRKYSDSSAGRFAPTVSQELLRTHLAQNSTPTGSLRERLLLLTILNHPALLDTYEHEFDNFTMSSPDLDKMRLEIIGIAADCRSKNIELESYVIKDQLKDQGLGDAVERLENDPALTSTKFARQSSSQDSADRGFSAMLETNRLDILLVELEEAELDAALGEDAAEVERAVHRVKSLREQINALERQTMDESDRIG